MDTHRDSLLMLSLQTLVGSQLLGTPNLIIQEYSGIVCAVTTSLRGSWSRVEPSSQVLAASPTKSSHPLFLPVVYSWYLLFPPHYQPYWRSTTQQVSASQGDTPGWGPGGFSVTQLFSPSPGCRCWCSHTLFGKSTALLHIQPNHKDFTSQLPPAESSGTPQCIFSLEPHSLRPWHLITCYFQAFNAAEESHQTRPGELEIQAFGFRNFWEIWDVSSKFTENKCYEKLQWILKVFVPKYTFSFNSICLSKWFEAILYFNSISLFPETRYS